MNLILSKVFRNSPFLFFLLLFIYLYAPFTVIDEQGFLSVRNEATKMTMHTEVRIDTLPRTDQLLLQSGITCNDVIELAKTLENFFN